MFLLSIKLIYMNLVSTWAWIKYQTKIIVKADIFSRFRRIDHLSSFFKHHPFVQPYLTI